MKAVIMAGGQGTRFWPISRQNRPKQFLKIASHRSMLQETVRRLQHFMTVEDVFVVCSAPYVSEVREQIPELTDEQIIVEPTARNTAACVGLAAIYLQRRVDDNVMVVLPADHVIQDVREFHQCLRAAEKLAEENWLVTFGIFPTYPATGYGYLHRGEALGKYADMDAFKVERFTEKPDLERAEEFLSSGLYYWNSGMFVWGIDALLAELDVYAPELYRALLTIDQSWDQPDHIEGIFSDLTSISIDYALMEKSPRVAVIPCQLGWSDVGNWRALEDVRTRDDDGIISNTRHLAIESRNCILHGVENKLIALVGIEDLVVVDAGDALLICRREKTEDVKEIVARLKKEDLTEYL